MSDAPPQAARSLAGQIAYVTGASGAIGGAIAVALAGAGAHLSLNGRNAERLRAAANRVLAAAKAAGAPIEIDLDAADLTDDTDLTASADRVLDRFGGVDLLIHSAGYFHMAPTAEAPIAELDRQYRVNLRAPYLLTQQLLPSLRQRRGQIVFINSTAGFHPARGGYAAYSASKHGMRAFADGLRDEVSPDGVRIISIFPGRTASRMQERVRELEGQPYDPADWMRPEDVAATVLHALTLPASAELTDLLVRPAG
jgi:NAD(P)-dependent dehydrogenase (short-subunit alcohol dehydrogenase family)